MKKKTKKRVYTVKAKYLESRIIRMTKEEATVLQKRADRYTDGNLSLLLREAAKQYIPKIKA